jgi:hypothetical protein
MKTFTLIVVLTIVGCKMTHGQEGENFKRTTYAIEMNQFITGSGFATGTELNVTIIPDHNKNLSFGVHFSPTEGKISGISVHHHVALIRRDEPVKVLPYAFYNMVYRITRTGEKNAEEVGVVAYGTYKCFEHHIGVGVDIRLSKNLHFSGGIGYGVYFGSIKRPADPDLITGEVSGSNGFGGIAKTGLIWVL